MNTVADVVDGPDSAERYLDVSGFLVSDGESVWLAPSNEGWKDKNSSILVGDKALLRAVLERLPGYRMAGALAIAFQARVDGVIDKSSDRSFKLAFRNVQEIWLITNSGQQRVGLSDQVRNIDDPLMCRPAPLDE